MKNTIKFSTIIFIILGLIIPVWPITLPLFWFFAYLSYTSGKAQNEMLGQNQGAVAKEQDLALKRPCPYCGEHIQRKAVKCRFCTSEVEPKYVDDAIANQQLLKIKAFLVGGLSVDEIAVNLNNEGIQCLANEDGQWTDSFVQKLVNDFSLAN